MQDINLKYYKPKALIILITLLFAIIFYINLLFKIEEGILSALIKTAFSVSIYYFVLKFLSKSTHPWVFKLFANVPNLNGKYEGHLKSDNDKQEIEEYKPTDDELDKTTVGKNLKVTITHTLSNIKVEIDFYNLKEKTKSSHSESISHYLKTTDNGIYELTYEYVNTKNGDHKHKDKWRDTEIKGFTRLRYKPSTKTFEGEYFNLDIKNPRSGQINLSLKQS